MVGFASLLSVIFNGFSGICPDIPVVDGEFALGRSAIFGEAGLCTKVKKPWNMHDYD